MTYAVNQTYTPMTKALGTDKTFYFFAGVCVLSFAWIQLYMFETKGRSLEDIQRLLKGEKLDGEAAEKEGGTVHITALR